MPLQPIVWSRFAAHRILAEDIAAATLMPVPLRPGHEFRGYGIVDEPACQIRVEEVFPGLEIEWHLAHDEIHICLAGEAECEFWNPPLFDESERLHILPDTVYFMPDGGKAHFRVLGDQAYRYLTITFPSAGYPMEPPASRSRTEN